MARERRCNGVVTNPKHPEVGRPCNRWAVNGSDRCQVHGGSDKKGWADPESLEHRCIARSSRSGSRCKKPAQRGMRVCRTHGGANPGAQIKAQQLLDRMVEPVLWELRELALSTKTSDSDKLRAIQMVLDRSMPKERKIEVELKPWEIAMQHIFTPSADGSTPVEIMKASPAETLAELSDVPGYTPTLEEIEAEVLEEDDDSRYNARQKLPEIIPPHSANERATVRLGSAEPPDRPGYRR